MVISVFVNPTQFAPGEDLATYPRTLAHDLEVSAAAGAVAAFVPGVETMYPPNMDLWVPSLPEVATTPGLEDASRPHFFTGVCQVVARLFDLTRPSMAWFGEKDWQQLQVVRAMVGEHQDRWPDLEIHAGETVREPDGLAMSSRNAYLDQSARPRALALGAALQVATSGEPAMRRVLLEADLDVDYAVIRDAETLQSPQAGRPRRALVAATLDGTRLIDNAAVG